MDSNFKLESILEAKAILLGTFKHVKINFTPSKIETRVLIVCCNVPCSSRGLYVGGSLNLF